MGKVEHDPIAIARPIDHPVAVIRRATEGLSLPGDVAERHVGSAGLRQIEVAFARIGWTEIDTELRIRLAVRSVGPFRESGQAEKGEVGGSRKDVEGKAQPYLAVERCHRRGQQKPGREPDLELPREALEGAHGAECSCNRTASQPSPMPIKEEPRRGDCRGSYALHRTHYHPDEILPGGYRMPWTYGSFATLSCRSRF